MRSREFLQEYDRRVTAQRFGQKILARAFAPSRKYTTASPEWQQQTIDELLAKIEEADPTPNKQYVPWLAKMYAEGSYGTNMEDLLSTTRDALVKFHALKNRKKIPAPRNDIMRYANMADFLDVMDEYEDPDEATREKDRGSAQEVFRNDQVRIIVPMDEAAACYYGQGTRWCTAAKNNNMFGHYAIDGDLYILLPVRPQYQGEKYQIHIPSAQFMDEGDGEMDPAFLLTQRFGDLLPFFREREPEIDDWLIFAPDAVLKPILEKMRTAMMEWAVARVSDWEAGDDYYYEWLVDSGYTYPEDHELAGTIDWDRVANDGVDYLSWNEEADKWYRAIQSVMDNPPNLIQQYAAEANPTLILKDLPDLMAELMRTELGRSEGAGAPEFLESNIDVVPPRGEAPARVDLIWRDSQDRRQRREIT